MGCVTTIRETHPFVRIWDWRSVMVTAKCPDEPNRSMDLKTPLIVRCTRTVPSQFSN